VDYLNKNKGGRMKKLMAMLLTVALISTSVPAKVQASWFSDLMGGLFTIITAPIWVLCQDNPTFRKNNPFRKKPWEERAQEERDRELAQKKELEREERLAAKILGRLSSATPQGQQASQDHIDYGEIVNRILARLPSSHGQELDYERIERIIKEQVAAQGQQASQGSINYDEIVNRILAQLPSSHGQELDYERIERIIKEEAQKDRAALRQDVKALKNRPQATVPTQESSSKEHPRSPTATVFTCRALAGLVGAQVGVVIKGAAQARRDRKVVFYSLFFLSVVIPGATNLVVGIVAGPLPIPWELTVMFVTGIGLMMAK
jgi:hypothetical protein